METAHLPLLGLMSKDINKLSPRLATMRLELLAYTVALEYRKGSGNTDLFEDSGVDPLVSVCSVVNRSKNVMSEHQRATDDDEELNVVRMYVQMAGLFTRKVVQTELCFIRACVKI